MRPQMQGRRAQISAAERWRASHQASEILWSWLAARPEKIIGIYLALPLELSLDALLPRLWASGRTVVAPRVEVEAGRMQFWRLNGFDDIALGPWNVREPTSRELHAPEIVLVPGLAFDPRGGRLGTGGGWYDRVLSSIPVKVGVCFECLFVPHVPCEPHDIRVDWRASETRMVQAQTAKPAG